MSTDDGTIADMITVSDEFDAPVHEIRYFYSEFVYVLSDRVF